MTTYQPALGTNVYVNGSPGVDLLILNYAVSDTGTGVTMGVSSYNYSDQYSTYGSARRNISATDSNVLHYISWDRIERFKVTGSSKDDILAGWLFDDTLQGGLGNDAIHSSQGGGIMDGGGGIDTLTADLSNVTSGITINLATPVTLNLTFDSGLTTTLSINAFEALGRNGLGDFTTGRGNDNLTTIGRNNDRIFTGDGNDWINPGVGRDDYLNGGEGLDTVILNYSQLDTGTGVSMSVNSYNYDTGPSTYGSARRNISTSDGNVLDYIYWDEIEQFQVTGTSKNDVLAGWNYSDTLMGGTGNDILHAGMGGGVFDGGTGIDILGANLQDSFSNITINLAIAADLSLNLGGITQSLKISTFESLGRNGVNDFITGKGHDALTALGRNNDRIFTSAGNDTINAGLGSDDYINGGSNRDLLVLNYSTLDNGTAVTMSVNSYEYGGESGDYASYGSSRRNISSSNGNALDYIYWDEIEQFQVTGTAKDDTLLGWWYSDTLNGGAGNDFIKANRGGGSFNGGDGVDVLGVALQDVTSAITLNLAQTTTQTLLFVDGKTASLTVTGFESLGRNGVDDFSTGSGNDTLTALSRNSDRIFTNRGNDVINAGLGDSDYVDGGSGLDLLSLNYSDPLLDTGTGVTMSVSTYWYGGDTSFYSTYGNSRRNVSTSSSTALDYINWDNIDHFQVTGSSKDDVLVGWWLNDTLNGGTGDDVIKASRGGGSFNGGDGVDVLGADLRKVTSAISLSLATAKTQTLTFEDGTTSSLTIAGFESLGRNGADDFNAGSGNDILTATGRNDDRIFTHQGNDVINAGLGSNDFVNGGAGSDLLILNYASLDTGTGITMSVSTYNYGNEVASYGSARRYLDSSNSTNLDYIAWDQINRFQITGSKQADSLYGWQGADLLKGGSGNDSIWGDQGNDSLYGESGIDILYGGLGNDLLDGGLSNDRLYGERGNDTLTGGDSNDTLVGGLGGDRLEGGLGYDRFAFERPNEGVDAIVDFTKGVDKIQINRSNFGSGLAVGSLISTQFVLGSSATNDSHRFIFNATTGALFFDSDGSRSLAQTQIATILPVGGVIPTLAASDIVIV